MERIFATYLIETPLAVEKAAATLAGEQSSGTFVAVPGETEQLKQRFAARVKPAVRAGLRPQSVLTSVQCITFQMLLQRCHYAVMVVRV